MFCPKCSHQQATESVRYCSRCGFQLDYVRELLASEDSGEPPVSLESIKRQRLRQVDILIGAGFMLVGAIKAAIVASNVLGPPRDDILFALFTLSFGYALFMGFAQLSHRQRGLTIGATLMFLGTLVALPMGELFGGESVILIAMILFPIILLWTRLARLFTRIFFGSDARAERIAPSLPEPEKPTKKKKKQRVPDKALMPAAHSVSTVGPKRLTTADLAQPPSVTEDTTSLLEK